MLHSIPTAAHQTMPAQEPAAEVHFTELETRLAGDTDGAYRKDLLDCLAALQAKLEHDMQRGMSRTAYEKWTAALSATAAAQEAVRA